jgi:hypothetical protein
MTEATSSAVGVIGLFIVLVDGHKFMRQTFSGGYLIGSAYLGRSGGIRHRPDCEICIQINDCGGAFSTVLYVKKQDELFIRGERPDGEPNIFDRNKGPFAFDESPSLNESRNKQQAGEYGDVKSETCDALGMPECVFPKLPRNTFIGSLPVLSSALI